MRFWNSSATQQESLGNAVKILSVLQQLNKIFYLNVKGDEKDKIKRKTWTAIRKVLIYTKKSIFKKLVR
jgi:hypothetical protein